MARYAGEVEDLVGSRSAEGERMFDERRALYGKHGVVVADAEDEQQASEDLHPIFEQMLRPFKQFDTATKAMFNKEDDDV